MLRASMQLQKWETLFWLTKNNNNSLCRKSRQYEREKQFESAWGSSHESAKGSIATTPHDTLYQCVQFFFFTLSKYADEFHYIIENCWSSSVSLIQSLEIQYIYKTLQTSAPAGVWSALGSIPNGNSAYDMQWFTIDRSGMSKQYLLILNIFSSLQPNRNCGNWEAKTREAMNV